MTSTKPAIWRCQCPAQCGDEDGSPCFDDVSQEDFLCDWCREHCRPVAAADSSGCKVGEVKG